MEALKDEEHKELGKVNIDYETKHEHEEIVEKVKEINIDVLVSEQELNQSLTMLLMLKSTMFILFYLSTLSHVTELENWKNSARKQVVCKEK